MSLDPNDPRDRQRIIDLWNSGAMPGPPIVHAIREGEEEALCGGWCNPDDKRGKMTDPNQVTCPKCYTILMKETELEEMDERLKNGQCMGCGSSDYTQVTYQEPRYGPKGLYCPSCFEQYDHF